MITGWLKLHRSILNWEWYKDNNTKILYIHLLINAVVDNCYIMHQQLQTGQYITTIPKLAAECHLTEKQTRTAIEHLKNSNNISTKTTNKYTIITILNYSKFQGQTNGTQKGRQRADKKADKIKTINTVSKPITDNTTIIQGQTKSQTNGEQKGGQRADIEKEYKNNKENKNIYNNSCCSNIYNIKYITDYINNNNYTYSADYFYNYYKSRNWCIGRKPIQTQEQLNAIMDNWQLRQKDKANTPATATVSKNETVAPAGIKGPFNNYEQRYYSEEEIQEILKRKENKQ